MCAQTLANVCAHNYKGQYRGQAINTRSREAQVNGGRLTYINDG